MRLLWTLGALALVEAVCVWAVLDTRYPCADKIVSVFVGTACLVMMGVVVWARVMGRE